MEMQYRDSAQDSEFNNTGYQTPIRSEAAFKTEDMR